MARLLPIMESLVTAEEVGIDTLEDRLWSALLATDAVFLPPTLVRATGHR